MDGIFDKLREAGIPVALEGKEAEQFLADPRRERWLRAALEAPKGRIVVEIIKSDGCLARYKPGDQFVFDTLGLLIPEETSKRPCIKLLGKLPETMFMMMDRLASGLDPNEAWVQNMKCYGGGLPDGNCGVVLTKTFFVLKR